MYEPPLSPLLIELLDPNPIERLVLQRDEFKLAIKGFTAIEQAIDEYLEEAFVEKLDGGVRSLGGFKRRFAVAVALGIVPTKYKALITELAEVRNRFAHGAIDEMSEELKAKLLRLLEEILREDEIKKSSLASLAGEPPAAALGFALIVGGAIVTTGGELARERRNAISSEDLRKALSNRLEESRLRASKAPTDEGSGSAPAS